VVLLTDAAMERLSSWIEREVLQDDCTILRNHPTQTASGHMTDDWQAQDTAKCAVLAGSSGGAPSELVVADQVAGRITKLILLPRGTDVLGNDKVQVGTTVYHVIDVYEPSTFEVSRRVLVQRSSLPGGR
jgi:hypothetical protein